jgi:hypothetical protein
VESDVVTAGEVDRMTGIEVVFTIAAEVEGGSIGIVRADEMYV